MNTGGGWNDYDYDDGGAYNYYDKYNDPSREDQRLGPPTAPTWRPTISPSRPPTLAPTQCDPLVSPFSDGCKCSQKEGIFRYVTADSVDYLLSSLSSTYKPKPQHLVRRFKKGGKSSCPHTRNPTHAPTNVLTAGQCFRLFMNRNHYLYDKKEKLCPGYEFRGGRERRALEKVGTLENGEKCSTAFADEECASGYCDSRFVPGYGLALVCAPPFPGKFGEACSRHRDCESPHNCDTIIVTDDDNTQSYKQVCVAATRAPTSPSRAPTSPTRAPTRAPSKKKICKTTGVGEANAGTPCHFPFYFDEEWHEECITAGEDYVTRDIDGDFVGDHVPWCLTAESNWGVCDCREGEEDDPLPTPEEIEEEVENLDFVDCFGCEEVGWCFVDPCTCHDALPVTSIYNSISGRRLQDGLTDEELDRLQQTLADHQDSDKLLGVVQGDTTLDDLNDAEKDILVAALKAVGLVGRLSFDHDLHDLVNRNAANYGDNFEKQFSGALGGSDEGGLNPTRNPTPKPSREPHHADAKTGRPKLPESSLLAEVIWPENQHVSFAACSARTTEERVTRGIACECVDVVDHLGKGAADCKSEDRGGKWCWTAVLVCEDYGDWRNYASRYGVITEPGGPFRIEVDGVTKTFDRSYAACANAGGESSSEGSEGGESSSSEGSEGSGDGDGDGELACECADILSSTGRGGADCESLTDGRRWCYIRRGACEDGVASAQLGETDWSYLACTLKFRKTCKCLGVMDPFGMGGFGCKKRDPATGVIANTYAAALGEADGIRQTKWQPPKMEPWCYAAAGLCPDGLKQQDDRYARGFEGYIGARPPVAGGPGGMKLDFFMELWRSSADHIAIQAGAKGRTTDDGHRFHLEMSSFACEAQESEMCSDSCSYANNGVCEDGGPNSVFLCENNCMPVKILQI